MFYKLIRYMVYCYKCYRYLNKCSREEIYLFLPPYPFHFTFLQPLHVSRISAAYTAIIGFWNFWGIAFGYPHLPHNIDD